MISKDTILRGLGDYTEKNLETDPAEQSEHIIQKIKNILEEAVNKNQGLALGAQS